MTTAEERLKTLTEHTYGTWRSGYMSWRSVMSVLEMPGELDTSGAPPLIITEEQVDEGIEILDRALQVADQEVEHTDTPGSRSTQES